jgi:hypothetical protein
MSAPVGSIFDPGGRPEWRLLGLAAIGLQDDEQESTFTELLSSRTLNWGYVLEQGIRHKMICMLADQIALLHAWPSVPALVGQHLREQLRLSCHRLATYRAAASEIVAELSKRSIPAACTKGIVLESQLYGGRGGRYLGDIDFMVECKDGEAIAAAMQHLGFVNGFIHRSNGDVQTHSRRDLIAYKLNPDHLPPFIKTVDDPTVPHIQVDFACSFTWARSKYSVPVPGALQCTSPIELPGTGGRMIPALDVDYLFLFTVLHLFREAWVSTWTVLEQDVNLVKFGDVIRSWSRWRDRLTAPSFRELIARTEVGEPVSWVLAHADRTFGTEMNAALALEGSLSEPFLGSAGPAPDGKPRRFGSMLNRLFAAESPYVLNP